MKEFYLSACQQVKLNKWQEHIKAVYGKYGLFTYSFTPHGVGTEVTVKSDLTGTSIDLSEPEKW